MKYAVQSSLMSEAIYVGRLNKSGTAFLDKEEATDMAISAVGMYVRDNYGGSMKATFPGLGFDVTVTVTPREEKP